jgi:FlaA1/EpsC-like NDP-sugar epimerase
MKSFQEKMRQLIQRLMSFSLINRWLVFVIDLLLCLVAYILSIFIQARDPEANLPFVNLLDLGIFYILFCIVSFLIFRSFRGLVRHTNFLEMWRPFMSLLFSGLALLIVIHLIGYQLGSPYLFVLNVFLISFALLMSIRFSIAFLYNYAVTYSNKLRKKMLIYDTTSHSLALAQWINRGTASQHQVQGFVTRDKKVKKTLINDLPVFFLNGDNVDWFMRKYEVSTILFPDYRSVKKEKAFVGRCIDMGVTVLVSPPFEGLDSHSQIRYQMRPIQFEDLLGREEIQIDMDRIAGQLQDKVLLITGSAGSIGSELVRQLAQFKPKMLVFYDIAETPLHNLRLEVIQHYPNLKFVAIIGDVRSEQRLDYVFRKYKPQVVYHAAAYKHVPLMEDNPCEAVLVNVLGTMNLSNAAVKYKVERFVMISTDKAVNPTNVMGASKRIAEVYVQSLAKRCEKEGETIRFVTTRFGNVLGSSGSVIPHFKEQIENGGPVTVTHPDIIRYFMTIPEACRLVLEAASFGQTGEIYVFDMGSPVKIVDLAKRMIELAGFVPDKDIMIEFMGLRPGEKLYEELLNDKETTMPTEHEKITVANVRVYEWEDVLTSIYKMIECSKKVDISETIQTMKVLVPEFKSQNSPFSAFDH